VLVKFLSFATVGVFGTLVHYSVLYFLVQFQGYSPVFATGCGALSGMLLNYLLNFKVTFNSARPHTYALPRFVVIAVVGMVMNQFLMADLSQRIYYLYAQVLTTLLVLNWNFLANHLWTFNMDEKAGSAGFKFTTFCTVFRSVSGLILVVWLIRLITLGLYPLYDPSESRYAEMARKMIETQNWVTPMIDYGVPFWGKPPLTIWLTAVSLSIGGINEFFARLPSLMLGFGMVVIVYFLAKKQRGELVAALSVLVLSSSVLFFVMSGSVAMDQCLTFGITLAMASFWLALKERKPQWGYMFFIGLSLGLMAKGPIALVLTGLNIVLWTILTKRWQELWNVIPWISGSLLMLAICLPWYLIAEQRTPGFLEYFIIGEHWKRFTESGWKGDLYGVGREHTRGIIWLYWLAGGFPWSLIFLKSLTQALLQNRLKTFLLSQDDWRIFCFIWMLSPLLFFTFSANLIWTYVLPGLPGFALLAADRMEYSNRRRSILSLSVPLVFLAVVMVYQFSEIDFYKSQKHLVDVYQQQAGPEQRLAYFKARPYSAQFYLQGKSIELPGIEALKASLDNSEQYYYVIRIKDGSAGREFNLHALRDALLITERESQAAEKLKKLLPVKFAATTDYQFEDDIPEAISSKLQPIQAFGRYMLFRNYP
jgi:4-amino-4-deoxy-L-arabinose transferase-like glycosyltransferase